jgi:hypothetical protein
MAKDCLAIVDRFKRSRISKSVALYRISGVIAGAVDDPTDIETVSRIADSYYAMLDHWESELDRGPRNEKRGADGIQGRGKPAARDIDEDGRSAGEDGNESDSADERGLPARKRVKLDMPCLKRPPRGSAADSRAANLARTNALLLDWSQDPKEARRLLMYHEDSPEFHESGWTEIVTGKCINLDTIHTIIASARTAEKRTETIGDIEIRFGTAESSSKRITSQSAWISAWNRASRAIRFAFPHRSDEVNAYGEYISLKFDQMLESSHSRVIRFDKAVRNRVASSRKHELSDFEAFRDIYDSHFLPDGKHHNAITDATDSTERLSLGNPSGFTRREPCIKWNNGDCPRTSKTCRYAHVCSVKEDGRLCARRHPKTKHGADGKSQ